MFSFLALYIWPHMNSQVSPDEPLSLEEFACRTVSVTFVVVNKFGVSQESPPLTLNVPGGISHTSKLIILRIKKRHNRDGIKRKGDKMGMGYMRHG